MGGDEERVPTGSKAEMTEKPLVVGKDVFLNWDALAWMNEVELKKHFADQGACQGAKLDEEIKLFYDALQKLRGNDALSDDEKRESLADVLAASIALNDRMGLTKLILKNGEESLSPEGTVKADKNHNKRFKANRDKIFEKLENPETLKQWENLLAAKTPSEALEKASRKICSQDEAITICKQLQTAGKGDSKVPVYTITRDQDGRVVDMAVESLTVSVFLQKYDKRPRINTETKPTENTETKPTENTETKPTENTETKPTENTETKPTENTETPPQNVLENNTVMTPEEQSPVMGQNPMDL